MNSEFMKDLKEDYRISCFDLPECTIPLKVQKLNKECYEDIKNRAKDSVFADFRPETHSRRLKEQDSIDDAQPPESSESNEAISKKSIGVKRILLNAEGLEETH